ncbi:MAG: hypothetical protein HY270_10605 [Deltaproteobacteria bacterium]|nr:hypothetical protein [Deltaproteobacteria bacterium]
MRFWLVGLVTLLSAAARTHAAGTDFVAFEAGQVRPLALAPDGGRLFAVNTPDNQLEIFTVHGGSLEHTGSVQVGLEPVAVAARNPNQVWVVNHLSDSVSIVDVAADPPRVVRTLLVGDEPRDIVFAGPTSSDGFTRAFITTARRGQNLPESLPANLTTPGTPRALVWVFDATNLGASLGGTPLAIIELFGDTPRALAASADGKLVYAAVFHSGNQTTSLNDGAVCNGGALVPACGLDGVQMPGGLPSAMVPGGLPAPNFNVENVPGPETGLIVKLDPDSGLWQDHEGRNWTNAVRFNLPDRDVFTIDALAAPPVETASVAHAGTILFNMIVNPTNGKLYVTNTDAHNEIRFEGPGTSSTTVRGHLHEARISVISGANVQARHLNKHIDSLPQGYRTTPMPTAIKNASLATPLGMALSSTGRLYVAAFGSSAIGTFDSTQVEDDSFVPDPTQQIALSGGGPTGLALDEVHQRLYVLTRFDNSVKAVDTANRAEIAAYPMHNPEPAVVVQGRHFLYDARLTSSNGEASCSSCHVFADFDSLGWDLGNPDDPVMQSFNPPGPIGSRQPFHPLKGPMTTQTLRSMAHSGPMHWRGDRSGGSFLDDPNALDAHLAFAAFNVAFDGLLGRDEGKLSDDDMKAFTDFILEVAMPPNPVRALDNQLTASQANGRNTYFNHNGVDAVASCNGCHALDAAQGFFGTGGKTTFENEPQEFKVPQLRNAYTKVGMFGMPGISFLNVPPEDRQPHGDQVRGFGFLHDGSVATLFDFMHATVFGLGEDERSDLEQFILAFDSNYAPIVGQQITLSDGNAPVAGPRIDLLEARAMSAFVLVDHPGAHECDLVVKGTIGGAARGYLFDPADGLFHSDRRTEAALSDGQLRGLAATAGQPLTYTCAPPGTGTRVALDRDADGFYDRDELDAGTNPADAMDHPLAACVGDCDGDGTVTIDEIIRGVDIVLGSQPLSSCSNFDSDRNGTVSIDELIQAINAALGYC